MNSLIQTLRKQKGFTIVELLIVIVIIGILATLVIVTFSGIQQRARDTQRQTDVNGIQSQVEAYYAQTGNYPTLAMLLDDDFRQAHMRGFPEDALIAPNGDELGGTEVTDGGYWYEAFTVSVEDGTACPAATGTSPDFDSVCQGYSIQADLEAPTEGVDVDPADGQEDDNYIKRSN